MFSPGVKKQMEALTLLWIEEEGAGLDGHYSNGQPKQRGGGGLSPLEQPIAACLAGGVGKGCTGLSLPLGPPVVPFLPTCLGFWVPPAIIDYRK